MKKKRDEGKLKVTSLYLVHCQKLSLWFPIFLPCFSSTALFFLFSDIHFSYSFLFPHNSLFFRHFHTYEDLGHTHTHTNTHLRTHMTWHNITSLSSSVSHDGAVDWLTDSPSASPRWLTQWLPMTLGSPLSLNTRTELRLTFKSGPWRLIYLPARPRPAPPSFSCSCQLFGFVGWFLKGSCFGLCVFGLCVLF